MSIKERIYVFIAVLSIPVIIVSMIQKQDDENKTAQRKAELKYFLCTDPSKPKYSILVEEQLNGEYSVSELFDGALSKDSRYFRAIAEDGTNPKIKTYIFRHKESSAFVEITADGRLSNIFDRDIAVSNFPFVCVDSKNADSKVNWKNYSSDVKNRIDMFVNGKECKKLQEEFDAADRNSALQRSRTGEGNSALMGYIDDKMRALGCYSD